VSATASSSTLAPDLAVQHASRQALLESAVVFCIVLPLLLANQISSAAPAVSFGFTGIYAWLRRRELGAIIAQRWLLLLAPAYALASVIWSDYPGLTAKHAGELLVTVLGGMLLAAGPRPARVLIGVWAAFAVFLAASWALGHNVGVGMWAWRRIT